MKKLPSTGRDDAAIRSAMNSAKRASISWRSRARRSGLSSSSSNTRTSESIERSRRRIRTPDESLVDARGAPRAIASLLCARIGDVLAASASPTVTRKGAVERDIGRFTMRCGLTCSEAVRAKAGRQCRVELPEGDLALADGGEVVAVDHRVVRRLAHGGARGGDHLVERRET